MKTPHCETDYIALLITFPEAARLLYDVPGSAITNGREPRSCLGSFFNSKLGCIATLGSKCMVCMHPLLKWKTRPRLVLSAKVCPWMYSWSFPARLIHSKGEFLGLASLLIYSGKYIQGRLIFVGRTMFLPIEWGTESLA